MNKKIVLPICMSAILFLFILSLASSVHAAGDCSDCNPPPTSPGNACRCNVAPTISITYSNTTNTIDSTHPVTLSASGGCPPYTWTTNNSNYLLNKNGITERDNEEITLTAISGSCGSTYNNSNIVCTVTVTDSCTSNPQSTTIDIRNTAGHWVEISYSGCSSTITETYVLPETIIGKYRWNGCQLYRGYVVQPGLTSKACGSNNNFWCSRTHLMDILNIGNYTLNFNIWNMMVTNSGFGTEVCCTNAPGSYDGAMFFNNCSPQGTYCLGFTWRLYEWRCG